MVLARAWRAGCALALVASLAGWPQAVWGQSGQAAAEPDARIAELRHLVVSDPASGHQRELGMLLGTSGRFAEAYALLRPWFEGNPRDVPTGLAAAFCAERLERLAEVEEILALLPPDLPQRQLIAGRVKLQRQQTQEGIRLLEEVLPGAAGALRADILKTLAEAYVAAGRSGDAARLLAELQPSLAIALQISRAHYKAGDSASALRSLRPFEGEIRRADDPLLSARAARHWGHLLLLSGELGAAAERLEFARQLDGADRETLRLLGLALNGIGRREEAARVLKRFSELYAAEPLNSVLDEQIGVGYDDPTLKVIQQAAEARANGDLALAASLLEREADLATADPRIPVARARLALETGELEQAAALLRRAVELSGIEVPPEITAAVAALERVDGVSEAKSLLDRLLP